MNPRLDASEGQRIQVTHIRTPGQFYVQLLEKHTQLETLQRHLHQHCRGGPQHRKQDTPHSLHPGTMVMAQFSLDKSWYRGVVTQTYVGGGGCDVFFMDYGNSERVALDRLRKEESVLARDTDKTGGIENRWNARWLKHTIIVIPRGNEKFAHCAAVHLSSKDSSR
ncbi:hypothetical protein ACOMHN_014019 [Nucella lapillus]